MCWYAVATWAPGLMPEHSPMSKKSCWIRIRHPNNKKNLCFFFFLIFKPTHPLTRQWGKNHSPQHPSWMNTQSFPTMSYTPGHTHTSGWKPSLITVLLKGHNSFQMISEHPPASISTNCNPIPQESNPSEWLGPTAELGQLCPTRILKMQDLN